MSSANWTTQFLVGSAKGSERQPDAPISRPGGDGSQGESPQHAVLQSIVGSRVGVYLITKRLGAGGVGEVFKGIDVMLEREVAVKVLRDELASDPAAAAALAAVNSSEALASSLRQSSSEPRSLPK